MAIGILPREGFRRGLPTGVAGQKLRLRLMRPIVTMVFLVIASTHGFAEETADRSYRLDEIVVTADKPSIYNRTGDVHAEETSSFFTVIKREEFEGKVEDLGDLIEKEVGVQVRRSGGLGSFSQASLRGSDADQVLVFLDGILLNDASSGTLDLSSIALADVAEIQIYRGVTPMKFGRSSIGGAINIRTLRAVDGFKSHVNAGYGSFNSRQASAFAGHNTGRWDYLISAGYLASDNDFKFVNNNGTKYNPEDDRVERRRNAQFDQYNILGKGGFEFSDKMRLDLMNQWFVKDQGIPNWNNSETNDADYDTARNIFSTMLTANDLGSLQFNTRTRFDYLWKREQYRDLQSTIGLGKQDNIYCSNRYGGDFYIEQPGRWWVLKLLTDMHFEDYTTEDRLYKKSATDSTRLSFNTNFEGDLLFFQDRFILTPAVKLLYLDDDLKSGTSIFGTPLQPQSKYQHYVNPQAGLKLLPTNWLTLKANVAEYVRVPTFFELFGDRGLILGNPDLKAETGLNVDGGFQIEWQGNDGWAQRFSGELSFFARDVRDMITFVYDARGIGRAVNISKARVDGVEASAQLEFLNFFRLVANITHLNTENLSELKAFYGKRLPGVWENSVLGRIEAKYRQVKVYGEYQVLSGLFYDSANLLPAKNQDLINVGMSLLLEPFTLRFDVENIKNINYQDFNGFPTPGISCSASVGYSYRF